MLRWRGRGGELGGGGGGKEKKSIKTPRGALKCFQELQSGGRRIRRNEAPDCVKGLPVDGARSATSKKAPKRKKQAGTWRESSAFNVLIDS